MKKIFCLIAVLSVLVACKKGVPKEEYKEGGERGYLVKVGDIAPDFSTELQDGTVFTLSEQRGKVVVLQFTASWCGVCRKEMPFIEEEIY